MFFCSSKKYWLRKKTDQKWCIPVSFHLSKGEWCWMDRTTRAPVSAKNLSTGFGGFWALEKGLKLLAKMELQWSKKKDAKVWWFVNYGNLWWTLVYIHLWELQMGSQIGDVFTVFHHENNHLDHRHLFGIISTADKKISSRDSSFHS